MRPACGDRIAVFPESPCDPGNMVLGHIMTAMPPIHAIPAVVAAAPGIATYNDLPLLAPRGILRGR